MAAKGPRILFPSASSPVSTNRHEKNNTSVWLDKFQGLPLFSTFNSKWWTHTHTHTENEETHRIFFSQHNFGTGDLSADSWECRRYHRLIRMCVCGSSFKGRAKKKKRSLSQPSSQNSNRLRVQCEKTHPLRLQQKHRHQNGPTEKKRRNEEKEKKKNHRHRKKSLEIFGCQFSDLLVYRRCYCLPMLSTR